MALASFCNTCWMALCGAEGRAFSRATSNVQRTQQELLGDLVRQNRDTWFGRQHRFGSIHSVTDFQKAVPLKTYEDYRTAIDRIGAGEPVVLSAERVNRLVPTGGSTAGEKLIPYTASLRRSFQRAVRAWIWDLFRHRPRVRGGRAYWSISPLADAGRRTPAGIPISFDDDACYLGTLEQRLIRQILAVPAGVARSASVAASQYATLFFLLRADDLRLISVWSPTFVNELLNMLAANWSRLCDDIERGIISVKFEMDHSPVTRRTYRPLPRRADALRATFASSQHMGDWLAQIWPSLALVSCWADGPSTAFANDLRRRLGGVEIQAKGLLATEAFVSIPRVAQGSPALAVRSHFFEFQPAGAAKDASSNGLLLAHELTAGHQYRVVVTTSGGLYRYQLHDQVVVVGFENEAPLLRFVGKADSTCDLVGEKLSAAHVQSALDHVFQEFGLKPTFARLAVEASARPGYALQIAAAESDVAVLEKVGEAMERRLCENPGYAYARQVGQLRKLRIDPIDEKRAAAITNEYLAGRLSTGQRLGDIKPSPLFQRNVS